jgi:hypothetical protein
MIGRIRGGLSFLRSRLGLLFLRGNRVQCNLCGFSARRFRSDSWHPHTVCPRCGSQVRHRLLAAALLEPGRLSVDSLVRGRRVLHFAPEKVLREWIEPLADQYTAADLLAEGYRYPIHLRADISHMPEVADGSYDLIIACDVLEHVPVDRRALREIRRVLAPEGWAILTVPQKDGLETTDEDVKLTDPAERERRFGQFDHVRIYGADFARRCAEAGFAVDVVDEARFGGKAQEFHVLSPPIKSPHPLATNYRKIFFLTPA